MNQRRGRTYRAPLGLSVCLGFGVLLAVAGSGIGPAVELSVSGSHQTIAFASDTMPNPYQPGELWGPGNPAEKCPGCNAAGLLGEDTAQSVSGNQPVNPMTGDFSTGINLFSVPAVGGDLSMSLSYDAQRAQAEADDPDPSQDSNVYNSPGMFGWGWQSAASASAGIFNVNGSNELVVNQPDGAQVDFVVPSSAGTCNSGGDPNAQKYTIPASADLFCGPFRNSSQGGYLTTSTDFYQLNIDGGSQIQLYNDYGQFSGEGTAADPTAITAVWASSSSSNNYCDLTGEPFCFTESDAAGRSLIIGESGNEIILTNPDTNTPEDTDEATAAVIVDPMGRKYSVDVNTNGDLGSVTRQSDSMAYNYIYGAGGSGGSLAHEMTSEGQSDRANTSISYAEDGSTATGMVQSITTPDTSQTTYSYSDYDCFVDPSGDCTDGSQTTHVIYPSVGTQGGEVDVDTYSDGVLQENCFGPSQNICWQFLNFAGDGIESIYPPSGGQPAEIDTDSAGDITRYVDLLGNVTNFMYNDDGPNNFDSLCWSAGPGVAVFSSDSCTVSPQGAVKNTYDQFGDELSSTDQLGHETTNGYYPDGQLCWTAPPTVTATQPPGSPCTGSSPGSNAPVGSTAYAYDAQGDVISSTVDYQGSNAQTTSSQFNLDDQLTIEVPPEGLTDGISTSNPFATSEQYYSTGLLEDKVVPQPTASSSTAMSTTSYQYDQAGDLTFETSPASATTNTYDDEGRLCWSDVTMTQAQPVSGACASPGPAGSTSYSYVADTGSYASVTDPNGNTTSYSYLDTSHPNSATTVTDAMGQEVQYNLYDEFGNLCETGPVLLTPGQSTCATQSAGDTLYAYDGEGQMYEETDPSGIETYYEFGDSDFPTSPTVAIYGYQTQSSSTEETTNLTYDAVGNETQAHQVQGNQTVTFGYDADNRLCFRAPVRTTATCASPPSGAYVSTYSYNGANELSGMVDTNGAGQNLASAYGYDQDGSLVSATDDNGRVVGYQYNDAEEVACIAYPLPGTGAASNCAARANPTSNLTVNRVYNAAGQLATVTDWNNNTTTFGGYDQYGQVGQITYPASTGESVLLSDVNANLTSEQYSGPAVGSTGDSWTYNADEQVASSSGLGGVSSPTDSYNDYKEVAAASNPNAAGTGSIANSFGYNNDGTLKTDAPSGSSTISYSYNAVNQLTSVSNPNLPVSSQVTSFAYTPEGERCWSDASSSVIGQACSNAPSGSTSYGWNAYGELCWSGVTTATGTPCQSPPPNAISYTYDGQGLRMTESPTTGSTLAFSWDTVDGPASTGTTVPQVIDDSSNYYIYGPAGDAPIEQIATPTSGGPAASCSYLASSPTGVQVVFGQSGAIEEQAAYTLYGSQVLQSNTHTVTPFGFQGAYTDPSPGTSTLASGFVYLVNRYYDPSSAQFLSVDPDLAASLEPYSIDGDDPFSYSDPLGLESVSTFLHWCSQSKGNESYCTALQDTPVGTLNYECLTGVVPRSVCSSPSQLQQIERQDHEVSYGGKPYWAFVEWPFAPASASDSLYLQGCIQFLFGIVCWGLADQLHFSGGLGLNVPGISISGGVVHGATADQYLCGLTTSAGGNFGVGGEAGTNPGTKDYATGVQVGTPGFGSDTTYGVLNC